MIGVYTFKSLKPVIDADHMPFHQIIRKLGLDTLALSSHAPFAGLFSFFTQAHDFVGDRLRDAIDGTRRAATRALPPFVGHVSPFSRSGCFRSLRLGEERKQAGNGRKGKTNEI